MSRSSTLQVPPLAAAGFEPTILQQAWTRLFVFFFPTKTNANNNIAKPVIQLRLRKPQQFLASNQSSVARVDSAVVSVYCYKRCWFEPHLSHIFSWKKFQLLQNTIDIVINVGLWLRLNDYLNMYNVASLHSRCMYMCLGLNVISLFTIQEVWWRSHHFDMA